MTDLLTERALWHLAIGYPEPSEEAPEIDDDYDRDEFGRAACWNCGGEGFVIVCCDDLCHGAGYCFHGDGHAMCRECNGEGVL